MKSLSLAASVCFVLSLAGFAAPSISGEAFDITALKTGRYVVMMRHALAPGTGDPSNFKLGDCSTQRNLSDAGRAQAKALGDKFRSQGLSEATVYSSQWCRCLETAQLLGLGPVKELPALNSFYRRPEDRKQNIAALRVFFEKLGSKTDKPVILVTHQVTISAITEKWTTSGASKVLKLNGSGQPDLAGEIAGE